MYNNPVYKYIKKQLKAGLHAMGYDVLSYNIHTSEEILIQTILRRFAIQTIIDVGANEGQFAARLIELGFRGRILSFEPISEVYQTLVKNASAFPQWETVNMGIGSEERELVLNVSENLASSSLFAVDKKSLEADPTTRTTRQERIRVTTIDKFLSDHTSLNKELLLKLDIQGFELEALKGSSNSLSQFRLIQVELSFIKVYEGAPLYREVISFLEEHNFELFTFIPAFVDAKTGRMLQADGIFVRKN